MPLLSGVEVSDPAIRDLGCQVRRGNRRVELIAELLEGATLGVEPNLIVDRSEPLGNSRRPAELQHPGMDPVELRQDLEPRPLTGHLLRRIGGRAHPLRLSSHSGQGERTTRCGLDREALAGIACSSLTGENADRATRKRGGWSRVVCLLPVRHAAEYLPGYLASAARCCDAIVALDDGSTDETRDMLAASPLVEVLVTNPPRRSYEGWDDGANRNRLLAAAAELQPDWILSLDADERIDADDADALRNFLDSDALPGCAYGLRHVRMWGENACERGGHWLYRLFAYEQGQVFPGRRLHFNPVPTSIPPRAWIRTTIRVQHFGASSERRRLARLAKYRQADPSGRNDFGGLDASPRGELLPWRPRPPGLPVLVGP